MDYRVVITKPAKNDVFEIYQWLLDEVSSNKAGEWLIEIEEAIHSFSKMPYQCPLARENQFVNAGIRVLLHGKNIGQYRILFTIEQNCVHVLHVRHASRFTLTFLEEK